MLLPIDSSQRSSSRTTFLPVLLLFACIMLLAFLFQGSRGIWQPDEGYYAGTAVTMLSKHTLMVPYLGETEVFLDKPPLIYWGIIAGLKLFGHSEFAVRFFNALSFALTAMAIGLLCYSMFHKKWLAMFSSLIYATMAVPFIAANFVTPDTILTLWTTVSALCFWKSAASSCKKRILWQMLLCASVALGFLAKGPAVLIPCGAMFVFLLITRESFRYFLSPWSLLGLLIFIAIGLSWYIWLSLKFPGAFAYFLDSQILGRLFTAEYQRNPGLTGALIYLPVLVFGSLPWSIIFIENKHLLRSSLLSKHWWKKLPQDSQRLFLLCWFFVPLVILSLASSKLGLYALPIFAPLAIAAAKLWTKKAQTLESPSLRTFLSVNRRPVALTASWIVLLLFSRLALAWYPTPDNMKTLWAQLDEHLPSGDYEICTIDDRADGLLFYGARALEHTTSEENAYPTFTPIDTVIQKLTQELPAGSTLMFIVIEDDELRETINTLHANGIRSRIVRLPHHRAILFPRVERANPLDPKNT